MMREITSEDQEISVDNFEVFKKYLFIFPVKLILFRISRTRSSTDFKIKFVDQKLSYCSFILMDVHKIHVSRFLLAQIFSSTAENGIEYFGTFKYTYCRL